MFIIISPAKRLDEQSKLFFKHTAPRNPEKTRELVEEMKKYTPGDLQKLMHINPKLADLNFYRYQQFKKRHNRKNSLQAIFAFNGDVFLGLKANTLKDDDVEYAQDHLRILSGLYGILRPLDLIQTYRLEMGTPLKTQFGNNLYEFWGDKITNLLKSDIRKSGSDYLLNLASQEYVKAINLKKIKTPIISATFKEYVNGEYKFYPVFGKKARGFMSRYVIENKISTPEDLKGFNTENYYFEEKLSTDSEFVFVR